MKKDFDNTQKHRGDIYYVLPSDDEISIGSEINKKGRPALIVSNDINNKYSSVYEVVYLTRQKKPNLPTHFKITEGTFMGSTVLGEAVDTLSDERLGDFGGRLCERDMLEINSCLAVGLQLTLNSNNKDVESYKAQIRELQCHIASLQKEQKDMELICAERDAYKTLYLKSLREELLK